MCRFRLRWVAPQIRLLSYMLQRGLSVREFTGRKQAKSTTQQKGKTKAHPCLVHRFQQRARHRPPLHVNVSRSYTHLWWRWGESNPRPEWNPPNVYAHIPPFITESRRRRSGLPVSPPPGCTWLRRAGGAPRSRSCKMKSLRLSRRRPRNLPPV